MSVQTYKTSGIEWDVYGQFSWEPNITRTFNVDGDGIVSLKEGVNSFILWDQITPVRYLSKKTYTLDKALATAARYIKHNYPEIFLQYSE